MPPKKAKTKKKNSNVNSESIDSEMSSDSESELSEQSLNEKEDEEDNDFDSEEEDPQELEDEFDAEADVEDDFKFNDKNDEKDVECFFKYDDENNSDFDEEENGITDSITGNSSAVPDNERVSINRMTKHEYVRLLGTRTKQLSMGAKPMIKNVQGLSSKEIALLELKNNTTPLIVKRPLPNKRFELWKVSELIKNHLYD